MPDVSTTAPAEVSIRCVHERSIVGPPSPTIRAAAASSWTRFPTLSGLCAGWVKRLGEPEGLVTCCEAGPCGGATTRC